MITKKQHEREPTFAHLSKVEFNRLYKSVLERRRQRSKILGSKHAYKCLHDLIESKKEVEG